MYVRFGNRQKSGGFSKRPYCNSNNATQRGFSNTSNMIVMQAPACQPSRAVSVSQGDLAETGVEDKKHARTVSVSA